MSARDLGHQHCQRGIFIPGLTAGAGVLSLLLGGQETSSDSAALSFYLPVSETVVPRNLRHFRVLAAHSRHPTAPRDKGLFCFG